MSDERDRLAESWLKSKHTSRWYIGEASEADWDAAYAAVDAHWPWHRVADTTGMFPGCETWQHDVKDGHLTVIVGREPGVGWHLSISHRTKALKPGRYPKWGEIKDARYRFTPHDVSMCMVLPPPEDYLNVHETCFHLWEHQPPDASGWKPDQPWGWRNPKAGHD